MRINEIITEALEVPKNTWETVISSADKQEAGAELVALVQNAYSNTPKGSMVNSLRDVIPSDWEVLDWDNEPDIDACVFSRHARAGEHWVGTKIQGIGHDGTKTSKDKVIAQVVAMLTQPGTWIESSDAMRYVLSKLNVPAVDDKELLQRLFNDPKLVMIDHTTYTRALPDGTKITETVFGHPKVR
jgi:hypothetical protein